MFCGLLMSVLLGVRALEAPEGPGPPAPSATQSWAQSRSQKRLRHSVCAAGARPARRPIWEGVVGTRTQRGAPSDTRRLSRAARGSPGGHPRWDGRRPGGESWVGGGDTSTAQQETLSWPWKEGRDSHLQRGENIGLGPGTPSKGFKGGSTGCALGKREPSR